MGMDFSAIREGDFVTLRARVARGPEPAMPGRPASLRAQIGEARLIVEAEDIAGHEPSLRVGDRVKVYDWPGVVRMLIDKWAVVKLDGRVKPGVVRAAALQRTDKVRAAIGVGALVVANGLRGRVQAIEGAEARVEINGVLLAQSLPMASLELVLSAGETRGWLNADVVVERPGDPAIRGYVYDSAPSAANNPHTLFVATPEGSKAVYACYARRADAAEAPCDV